MQTFIELLTRTPPKLPKGKVRIVCNLSSKKQAEGRAPIPKTRAGKIKYKRALILDAIDGGDERLSEISITTEISFTCVLNHVLKMKEDGLLTIAHEKHRGGVVWIIERA